MKKLRQCLVAVLVLILMQAHHLNAQTRVDDPQVPSANSLNLGLFGEVPVSLYAGLPQVSVPLYEVNASGLSLPISISYHASGFRPEVHPSWIGMGWSLSAGGSINREVRGVVDESDHPTILGYYYNHNQNSGSNWSSTSYLSNYRLDDLMRDAEPDIFSFSFPGNSGKFFMDTNGQWKVQSEKPVKVVFNGNFIPPFSNTRPCSPTWQSVNTFESFTIIDDKGIQYVFGGSEAIEYSDVLMTFMPGGGSDVFKFTANAWQLTKIIAPDKQDSIVLNYERGPYQASLYKNYYSNLLMNSDCSNFSSVEANVGGRLISPVYLTSIVNNKNDLSISFTTSRSNELDYTTANFNELFDDHAGGVRRSISELVSCETGIPYFSDYRSDPDGAYTNSWDRLIWLKLNAMRVKHKGVDLKMISFVYDNTSSERLRLSEVNFKKTTSSTNILRYSFDYYEDYSLPVYLSVMGDHWGFNNTSSINSNVTPSNIFTLRSPTTLARARSGSLSQITYPTGGFSELIYEMHDYSSKVDNDTHETSSLSGTAGGLRLSQKIDHDNEGGDVSTSYYYVKNYQAGVDPSTLTSSGVLEGEPAYYYGGTVKDIGGSSFNYSNFSSSPVVPLTSNSSGQHIGYSEVAEVRGDGAYTIRKYTNHDNGYRDYVSVNTWNPQLLPQAPFNSRGHERGKLLGEYNYASDGAAVASTEYTYTRPASLTSYASRSIHQHFKNNCTNNANSSAVTRTAYYLYYYPFQLTKITSKTYGSANSNAVTSVKDMTYNSRNQLSTEKFTNSKGVQKTVAYTYACDQISGMSAKHMIDYVRTTTTSIPGETLSKQTVEFAEWAHDPGNFYPSSVKQQRSTSDPDEVLVTYDLYNMGKPAQSTHRGGMKQGYVYGYNNTMQVAKVVNAANNYTSYYEPKTETKTSATQRTSKTVTFTTYYAGDITLAIRLTSPPTRGFFVSTSLKRGSSMNDISLCFAYGSYTCGPNSPSQITYSNMPAGTYTLTFNASEDVFANLDYTYQGRNQVTSGMREFFLENFEESTSYRTNTPHTGDRYSSSSTYTVSWVPPSSRSYVITYWYLSGGKWYYSSEIPYNGTSYTMSGHTGYDDIRVYPADAQVTTYTYKPLIGMASIIDPKGLTKYFYYDDLMHLERIEDDQHFVEGKYNYNYQH